MKKLFYILSAALLTASCATIAPEITRESQYPRMYEERPLSLLVMPPINNTSFVEAKDLLYTSISKPLAEAGYYVISPFLAMDILRAESAYDAELFVAASLTPFKNYFGADAVVFSEINSWTKRGFGIDTNIRYFIRSTTSGEIIFDRSCDLYLDLSVDSGQSGLFAALVELAASAIVTASTEHITAARKANVFIFSDLPRGRYSPDYDLDRGFSASARDIKTTVK
ncbi:MAG: DUF799 family lipoprotein [Bacteroidales bacterium]|nr:DUF799 family lipoprotein [Bacteroidales bacterium]